MDPSRLESANSDEGTSTTNDDRPDSAQTSRCPTSQELVSDVVASAKKGKRSNRRPKKAYPPRTMMLRSDTRTENPPEVVHKVSNVEPATSAKRARTDRFGEIEGIPVGTTWRLRLQASQAGVHRPSMAGISGKPEDGGAFSVVVSGTYPDDVDNGDVILYTGCGGFVKEKGVCVQKATQTLTKQNKALALSCWAPFNEAGAGSTDGNEWRKGKEIRVLRGYRLNNEYAPECGYRYDGIYKVAKYYSDPTTKDFVIWRFVLKRDDETPAPWTKKGKKSLNLRVINPDPEITAKAEQLEAMLENVIVDDDEEIEENLIPACASSMPEPASTGEESEIDLSAIEATFDERSLNERLSHFHFLEDTVRSEPEVESSNSSKVLPLTTNHQPV